MIKTAMSKDHALWDQIVRKEAEQKARFEYLTGETVARKFFNGTNWITLAVVTTTFLPCILVGALVVIDICEYI